MSTFNSGLNSASTIFTIDIYYRHINKDASQHRLVLVGRIATAVFVIVACLWAPVVASFGKGMFDYIQKFWGFISPGIVAAFLGGLILKKAPPLAATGAMLLGIPVYGLLLIFLPDVAFLHHMAITFLVLMLYMLVVTWRKPLKQPQTMPTSQIDTRNLPSVRLWGGLIILLTITLYILFW
jgi:SSS family solute:Na+ symporter